MEKSLSSQQLQHAVAPSDAANDPEKLANWLKPKHKDIHSCAKYLLQTALFVLNNDKSTLNAIWTSINHQFSNGGNGESLSHGYETIPCTFEKDLGEPLEKNGKVFETEVSCLIPRGKFTVRLHKKGAVLTSTRNSKEIIAVENHTIDDTLVVFPKPDQCKPPPKPESSEDEEDKKKKSKRKPLELVRLVLIPIKKTDQVMHTTFNNHGQPKSKQLTQVCFPLPVGRFAEQGELESDNLSEQDWIQALKQAFRLDSIVDIQYSQLTDTSNGVYKSVGPSSNPGMPFVSCHLHINQGHLFPLKQGVLFFKPPIYVPRSALQRIACGRGGNTRFVDLTTKLVDGEIMEFNNIAREELESLNDFIHHNLRPNMKQASQTSSIKNGHSKKLTTPTPTTADNVSPRIMRSKRKAAAEADEVNRQHMETMISGGQADDDTEEDEDEDQVNYDRPSSSDSDDGHDDSDSSSEDGSQMEENDSEEDAPKRKKNKKD